MPAPRAKGPDDYGFEFVSSEDLKAMTTKASSPWAPVLEKFVKSGQAAIQIKVSNAREGNRLASQLRKFGAKTVAMPTADGGTEYFAFLIITARPGQ